MARDVFRPDAFRRQQRARTVKFGVLCPTYAIVHKQVVLATGKVYRKESTGLCTNVIVAFSELRTKVIAICCTKVIVEKC